MTQEMDSWKARGELSMIENTSSSVGFVYEMGGTWVTHHMGYLFREMVRYKMDRHLITTGRPWRRGWIMHSLRRSSPFRRQATKTATVRPLLM